MNSGFAEVIAADNASPDGSVAAVKAASPDGTVVRMQENLGFAGGGNTVLRQGLSQWASLVETV